MWHTRRQSGEGRKNFLVPAASPKLSPGVPYFLDTKFPEDLALGHTRLGMLCLKKYSSKVVSVIVTTVLLHGEEGGTTVPDCCLSLVTAELYRLFRSEYIFQDTAQYFLYVIVESIYSLNLDS